MKQFLNLSILAVCALMISGCGEQQQQTKEGSDAKAPGSTGKPRVALVMKSLANEFFQTMEIGAVDYQKSNPDKFELISTGIKDEKDVTRQIDIVEQMMAQNVKAVVIAPADSKALVPAVQKAQEKGAVVVNIDNKFDAAVLADKKIQIPFVGPNNRTGAEKVGLYVAEKLKAGDKVAIIEGAPNAFNGEQRKLGFEDAIKAKGLTLVASQTAGWDMNEANNVMANLIVAHSDLKAVFCANDNMALGAISAIAAANKTGQILVAGFDNISAAKQMLKEGKLAATADQYGDKLAVYGIEYALTLMNNGAQPKDLETTVTLITADSVK